MTREGDRRGEGGGWSSLVEIPRAVNRSKPLLCQALAAS